MSAESRSRQASLFRYFAGNKIPLEFPRAAHMTYDERRMQGELRWRQTFPDSSPQDISIVYVHHDPLAIQGIFVNRSRTQVRQKNKGGQWICANIYPRGSLLVM